MCLLYPKMGDDLTLPGSLESPWNWAWVSFKWKSTSMTEKENVGWGHVDVKALEKCWKLHGFPRAEVCWFLSPEQGPVLLPHRPPPPNTVWVWDSERGLLASCRRDVWCLHLHCFSFQSGFCPVHNNHLVIQCKILLYSKALHGCPLPMEQNPNLYGF